MTVAAVHLPSLLLLAHHLIVRLLQAPILIWIDFELGIDGFVSRSEVSEAAGQ